MSARPIPTSSLATEQVRCQNSEPPGSWPLMPTETDIYILPDGQVVIADMPAELALLADQLGDVEPCAVTSPPST